MPYKDPEKQRLAVLQAVRKTRGVIPDVRPVEAKGITDVTKGITDPTERRIQEIKTLLNDTQLCKEIEGTHNYLKPLRPQTENRLERFERALRYKQWHDSLPKEQLSYTQSTRPTVNFPP